VAGLGAAGDSSILFSSGKTSQRWKERIKFGTTIEIECAMIEIGSRLREIPMYSYEVYD